MVDTKKSIISVRSMACCFFVLAATIGLSLLFIHVQFIPVRQGNLYLPRQNSSSYFIRESPYGIHHIHASSLEGAAYTQGFAHAQDRLWQMEKQRRLTQGRLSEIFGEKALQMDKFSLAVGYKRAAQETWETPGLLKDKHRQILQAYADGVNDFIEGVGYFKDDITAFYLPPEFTALGIKKLDPWHPIDTICVVRMLNFHLTQNWSIDLLRSILGDLEGGDIKEFVEELLPFHSDFHTDQVPTLDEKEMGELGLLHPEKKTLQERYKESRSKDTRGASASSRKSSRKQATDTVPSDGDIQMEAGNLASNAWVISGKHTENGMPILSSDPHLTTGLPSFWIIQDIQIRSEVDGKNVTEYVAGSTVAGLPLVMIGRTKTVTWGITAGVTDTSDLYEEQLDESGEKYMVDGQWRDLNVINYEIKVKDWEQPEKYDLKLTHRGPVISSKLLSNAVVLFGSKVPIDESKGNYSMAWAGHEAGDSMIDLLETMMEEKTVPKIKEQIKSKVGKWNGPSLNYMFADTEGNIGYMLVSSIPIRKNHHPLLGCRVLDGTTSMHDWEGFGDFSTLPFHINTDKGFYVTSNQRQYPDTARDDIGATHGSTARAQRLHHFIASKIKEGHKFSVKDNLAMQTDTMDVHAQRLVPHILKATKDILANDEMKFDAKVKKDIQEMYEILEGSEIQKDGKATGMFDGDMRADSVQASIYSLWHYYFYSSLLRAQTVLGATESKIMKDDEAFWNTKTRLSLIDNYAFTDFYQRLVEHLSQNPTSNKYDKICQLGYKGHEYIDNVQAALGPELNCQYNVARAFADVKSFLVANVSYDPKQWKWSNIHVNEYPNHPWSLTKLKPIWHREVPIGGNGQSPGVSKYGLNRFEENGIFKSTHTANYKQVVNFGTDPSKDVTLMSIDSGQAGNLLAANYFDMNALHLKGDELYPMTLNNFKKLLNDKNYVLKLHPLSSKKKRVIRPIEEQFVDEHLAKEKLRKQKERAAAADIPVDDDDIDSMIKRDEKKNKGGILNQEVDPDPSKIGEYYAKYDEEVIKKREEKASRRRRSAGDADKEKQADL